MSSITQNRTSQSASIAEGAALTETSMMPQLANSAMDSLLRDTCTALGDIGLRYMADHLKQLMLYPSERPLTPLELVHTLAFTDRARRENNSFLRNLRTSGIPFQDAVIDEYIDIPERGLDHDTIHSYAECEWIQEKINMLITGPTGTGKTNLASAIGISALHKGMRVLYSTVGGLLDRLATVANDHFSELLREICAPNLLIIDDLCLESLNASQCANLFQIVNGRDKKASLICVSPLPVSGWYKRFEDPLHAEAILDRITHSALRIDLKGPSMRKILSDQR